MSPAQRRKALHLKNKKGYYKKTFLPLIILIVILGLVLFFIFSFFLKNEWDGKSKLVLATTTKEGEILVSSFDPEGEKITTLKIPGNTQLTVSRQLGSWKAKSLWQLGTNENLEGKLIVETLAINFHLPIYYWGNEKMNGFSEGSFFSILKSIFSPGKTNLDLKERIRLGIFSLGIKQAKRDIVNLEETSYLKKVRLTDGEDGYSPANFIGGKILLSFSDFALSQKNLRVAITDVTGKYQKAEMVGGVVEVIGAKVASINREREEDLDCEVSGNEKELMKKIVAVFSCYEVKAEEGNFDVMIKIGSRFAKRF